MVLYGYAFVSSFVLSEFSFKSSDINILFFFPDVGN